MAATRRLGAVDDLLRAEGAFAVGHGPLPYARLALLLVIGGALYGAVMGSSGVTAAQSLYSALKVPLLLVVTLLLCLPSFYVVNSVLGLADDFPAACRGVLSAQVTLAVTLAALAPVTAFFYASHDGYHGAKLLNGLQFALASLAAQQTLKRHYRPLVANDPRHRLALIAWPLLYIFVALQMAYALRPFVGNPRFPTEFFREHWMGNVYIDLWWSLRGALGR